MWAALRELGRDGVADLVDRCCRRPRRFADAPRRGRRRRVVNDVVLNQVLVRFGDDDALDAGGGPGPAGEGAVWLGTTTWQGRTALRVSFSDHATGDDELALAVEALRRAVRRS